MRRWLPEGVLVCQVYVGLGLGVAGLVWAADTATVAVSAVVLSDNDCRFRPQSPLVTLNFGTLDPANPIDKTVSTTLTFRCRGRDRTVVWAIEDDDGLYETGPNQNRMRHTTVLTEFIPYVIPRTGTTPRNQDVTVTLTATVRDVDYQNAFVGNYADVVTLTLLP
ncbi:MAG: spore coat U domain-containing protein [Acidobacteria bacterium]|nr:spore coat U domain-containing protein [Acidobacteriota bacterium]MDW7983411.1 spore coat protein U domain-containing protein [Acidobacteriota bacterium]